MRRGRQGRRAATRAATGLAALAAACLVVVAWQVRSVEVPDPLAGAPTIAVDGIGPDRAITITWLGDTLLGDAADDLIDRRGPASPLARLPTHPSEEVVVLNLEGPLTTETEPHDPARRWSYNARPEVAAALADHGVDAISLANNHAMDRGEIGLADTDEAASGVGLATFGAGAEATAARLPLLVESGVGRVAVFGFSDEAGSATATSNRPGVRRLELDNLGEASDLARAAGVEWLVAFVHWGENYSPVDARQRRWASAFAAAGYDLVVGAGSHVPQPIADVDGMPVVYSLGNYVFGTPGRFGTDDTGYGLVVSTVLADDAVELVVRCIETDNRLVEYQPRPCPTRTGRRVLTAVDPALVIDGDGVGRRRFDRRDGHGPVDPRELSTAIRSRNPEAPAVSLPVSSRR